jgi:mRNA interferase MazF
MPCCVGSAQGFDETITPSDQDFTSSGLVSASLIRFGFLSVVPGNQLIGSIGQISAARHRRLLENLSEYLLKP